MAPRTKSKRIACTRSGATDRMSRLPTEVLHYIISMLTMQQVAIFSCVSKGYRDLCISVPCFYWDAIPYFCNPLVRSQFQNYVERFIALRKGMEIVRVWVRWCLDGASLHEEYRVLTWLQSMVNCRAVGLMRLELILSRNRVFCLPHAIYLSKSLKNLVLQLHGGALKLPSPAEGIQSFCSLRSLSLSNVILLDEHFGDWISSCCNRLLNIELRNVKGVKCIRIKSSTLEWMLVEIQNGTPMTEIAVSAENMSYLCLNFHDVCSALKISTPKLETFVCSGIPATAYHFGAMPRLYHVIFSSTILMSLFRYHSQLLTVLGCNIWSLTVTSRKLNDELAPALAWILEATPNLTTLSIKGVNISGRIEARLPHFEKRSSQFSSEFWESQKLRYVEKLEHALVDVFWYDGKNEMELIKYLLKNAKKLKKMVVRYVPPLTPGSTREIERYERASATAQLVLTPYLPGITTTTICHVICGKSVF